jgi:hypothetical protein
MRHRLPRAKAPPPIFNPWRVLDGSVKTIDKTYGHLTSGPEA